MDIKYNLNNKRKVGFQMSSFFQTNVIVLQSESESQLEEVEEVEVLPVNIE